MELKKRKGSSSLRRTLCFFFILCFYCCFSVSSSASTLPLGISCPFSAPSDSCFQEESGATSLGRRLLGGPGSSPPRCTSKCGKCTPCKPVHVPVPPGTPVTAEYYPEAWRCKCGNKLYMP
ncbi:EPIDERMAL PATTERNING FACTOR-like protein 6 [Linum perenne]